MTELDLDALSALAGAATPGPWRVTRDYLGTIRGVDGPRSGYPCCEDDNRFIAAAREAVPALIASVRGLERMVEFWRFKAETHENFLAALDIEGLVKAEREACAQLCDVEALRFDPGYDRSAKSCAQMIRKRGAK